MDPYYKHQHTFGPSPEGDLFGIGNMPTPLKDIRPVKLIDVLRSKDVKLWGIGHTPVDMVKAKPALTAGTIIAGLAINYALGRYVAAPVISRMTGERLSKGVRNAIGITAMVI
tara:strand:+ start:175 stop:513 length:339 start_codon:yes stop_codon:yes gene_type:complete